MSILSSIGRIAAEFSAARARHQTERTIRSLPAEIQKDIGWPDAFGPASATAHGAGTWAGEQVIVESVQRLPRVRRTPAGLAFLGASHALAHGPYATRASASAACP